MTYLLLHNPRCSKSRAAKALLEDRGVEFEVRHYLDHPLSADELRMLRKRLRRPPSEWIRWNEDLAQGFEKDAPEQILIQAIATYPRIMERPILIAGDHAAVGRPEPAVAFGPMLE